ncbi:MAG: histidine kinase dimerization/phospho-acceptor domain-containing protein [bacterium]
MKKVVSFYIALLVIIFLIFNNFFVIKFWELYFIESKKKEIKYITDNILDVLRSNKNLETIDRNYLLYLFSNLPEYVYFIVYDEDYKVLVYYPAFFNVDYEFLKSNPFGQEKLVFQDYILTYFVPFNRYMLAVEMNLNFIKDIRKELIYMASFIISFSFPLSYLLSILIFRLIEKRINIIKEFVFNVSLGKFDYDINYKYNDELKEIFTKIKLMKDFLVKYINEIEQNKKILEEIFNNSPFFVIILDNYDKVIYLNKNIDQNLKEFFLKNLIDINLDKDKIIKFNKSYFKMLIFEHNLNKIGIFIDITDFYNLNELKDRALAMISHDLRTPIASIKANLEFLVNKNIEPEIKNKINSILLELDRINYMIYRYLDYSRIKLGKKIANLEIINLYDFINFINDFVNFLEYSDNFDFDFHKINQNLEEYQDIKNKNILIDLNLFKQLISNLFDNAYKYSIDKKVLLNIVFDKDKFYLKVGNLTNLENYKIINDIMTNDSNFYLYKGKLGLLIVKEIANILNIKINLDKENLNIEDRINLNEILLYFILEFSYI